MNFLSHSAFRALFIAIVAIFSLQSPSSFAQNRTPEIKINKSQRQLKEESKDPNDSLNLEERPYFLLIDQSEKALEQNDYEAAALRLVEAMSVEPDNPLNVALLTNLGMIYYYNEQDSMALRVLDEAVRRSPRLIAAHEKRARVLTGMGRDKEAYEEYGRVIDIDSLNTSARFYHAMMALHSGKLPEAEADIACLNRVVPLWTNTVLAHATLFSMTGREREAISLFRRLLDKDKLPEYYAALAGCLIAVDDLNEASRVIGEGMELFKDDAELYFHRAVLNHKRFLPDEAHRDAKRAIQLGADPKRVAAVLKK